MASRVVVFQQQRPSPVYLLKASPLEVATPKLVILYEFIETSEANPLMFTSECECMSMLFVPIQRVTAA